jgi:enhancing lycopene biosynthesis protein 2
MPHVLVVLSGCGYLDGAEISEAVISLLALSRGGARVTIAAPDQDQHHVVDHLSGQVTGERRNVLREAARIARGRILPLAAVRVEDHDAIWMPGGFGAAKNLSSFAFEGASASVQPELAALLRGFREAGKPIGAICIAPAVLALALREGKVTIGEDPGCAGAIEALGGQHQACPVTELCVDEERRIVTAPAYMYDATIADVATGIEAAVGALLRLCGEAA